MTRNSKTCQKHISYSTLINEIKRIFNANEHKSATIMVRGYSMRPFLEDCRDKVVLIPPLPPRKGQVILAEVKPNIYILHRIIKVEGDIITMRGDGNAVSHTETFHANNIIATVKTFIRKGKSIEADSKFWRIYSSLWEMLCPLRRVLLAIYSRTYNIIHHKQ